MNLSQLIYETLAFVMAYFKVHYRLIERQTMRQAQMLKNEYEVDTKLTQDIIMQGLTRAGVERSAAFSKMLRAIYRTIRIEFAAGKQDAQGNKIALKH